MHCLWNKWALLTSLLVPLSMSSCAQSGTEERGDPDAGHADVRRIMVQHQLEARGRDIRDERVLLAMREVPRHEFVPARERLRAYEDYPLPIGYGQTISQPFIVAFMTEQLRLRSTDRVLEIGTGSGYQAAILSRLVDRVYTLEIVRPLAENASKVLRSLGYTNVFARHGDGYLGWPEEAPFDAIIVTCAPEAIPEALIRQLRDGGRMIIPVGSFPSQQLVLLEKSDGNIRQRAVLDVRFVPMVRGAQGGGVQQ